MSLDSDARRCFGVSYSTLVRRIRKVWDAATPGDIEAGARWYPDANAIALDLAHYGGTSVEHTAAVIAHLSPRTAWTRNILAAYDLILRGEKLSGIIGRNYDNAVEALAEEGYALESTFGGPKTLRFFRNILGDEEAVTVDVWACRVAGVSDTHLGRKGAYDVLEAAYRAAARQVGVAPSTMQATTWIVARGGRAA